MQNEDEVSIKYLEMIVRQKKEKVKVDNLHGNELLKENKFLKLLFKFL